MKKKQIIGLILIVAAALSAFGGYSVTAGAPEIQNTLKNAVYVSDGKVLPENEGKIVIVPGTLDPHLPFVDKETGICHGTKTKNTALGNEVAHDGASFMCIEFLVDNVDDISKLIQQ